MKRLYDYTVILRPEDNGTIVAYVPAIPGCYAWGQTPQEVGDFDGAKAVGISQSDDYVLDIDADGPWLVDISQPRPETAQSAPILFIGTGQQVPHYSS